LKTLSKPGHWLILVLAISVGGLMTACSPSPAQTSQPVLNVSPTVTIPAMPPSPRPSISPVEPTASLTPPAPTLITLPAIPESEPTPTSDPCPRRAGTLVDDQIDSKQLGKPLSFRIYLPPCYNTDWETRYPVLYLLHGQGYQDDQWTRLGVAQTADNLINLDRIPPLMIVMPYDSDWRQPTEAHFDEALVEELLPWIDSHFLTRADRPNRAIGGLSRGAAWALHLGLTDWRSFGAIGGHSLPIFRTDTNQIPKWLDAIPTADLPRIYLDVGTKDADLASNLGFEALLDDRHIPHEWHLFTGYHDEAYWNAHLEGYLLWYSQGWTKDSGK